MFAINTPTPATLTSVTPRTEAHGDDEVPAMSFGFRLNVPNTWLDLLSPGLTDVFYEEAEGGSVQGEIEGLVVHKPKLRNSDIGSISLKNSYEGWRLRLSFGIDNAIAFGGCKVDKFHVNRLLDGGSIELQLRVGTSDLSDESAGKMVMLNGSEHSITITAPDADAQPSGAKVQPPPAKSATDLFVEGVDDEPRGGPAWPFPKDAPTEAPPQSATVENVKGKRPVKYRDAATGETWSGRGVMPTWLKAAMKKGRMLSEFEASAAH